MEEIVDTAVDTAVEEIDGGNLPSAVDEAKSDIAKYALEQEVLEKYIKSGKLFGKYESMQAMLDSHAALEAKHSNLVRDMKSGKYQEVDQTKVEEQRMEEVSKSLIPKFLEAGMVLTPEIEAEALEAGMDIRDLKLDAIELRESVTKAYSIVGGEEAYKGMIEWGMNNLTESQQRAFDIGLEGATSEFAIKGLYADYMAATANGASTANTRIRGDGSSSAGVRPYSSQAEMLKDRAYVNGQGRNDSSARELHNRRMGLTPDNVVYGR